MQYLAIFGVLVVVVWFILGQRRDYYKRVRRLLSRDTKGVTSDPGLLVRALFAKHGYFDRAGVPSSKRRLLAVRILSSFGYEKEANEEWVAAHSPRGVVGSFARGFRWLSGEFARGLSDPNPSVRLQTIFVGVLLGGALIGFLGFVVPLIQSWASSSGYSPQPVSAPILPTYSVPSAPTLVVALPTVTMTPAPLVQTPPVGVKGSPGGKRLSEQDRREMVVYLDHLFVVAFGGPNFAANKGQVPEILGAVQLWLDYIGASASEENRQRYQQAVSFGVAVCSADDIPSNVTHYEYFWRFAQEYDLDQSPGARVLVERALSLCEMVGFLAQMYPPPIGDRAPEIWGDWINNWGLAERLGAGGDARLRVDALLTGALADFPNRDVVLIKSGLDPDSDNPFLEKIWEEVSRQSPLPTDTRRSSSIPK